MKKLILIPVLLMFLNTFATDLYVAKNGNDSNLGTIDSPFLTITKAASVAVAGDTVFIREGTYEETLTPLNSGTAGNPIIFQSYPGERVIISAMEALSGWTQDSGSIYKTTIAFTSLGQENFVMHGETALDLARWPNKTSKDPFELNTLRNTGGSASTVSTSAFLAESSIPSIDWTGGAVWFYGDKSGAGWLAWKETITSSTSGRVNFNLNKNPDWIRTVHAPADIGDFFLEGVKGALDFKNEWYYDDTTDELFVQLPSGSAPADGEVKMRRRLKTIDLKHKKYIEIRNLAVFGGSISLEDDTRWTTNTNTTNNILSGVSSFYGGHTQGIVTGFSTNLASINVEGSNNVIEKCEIAFGATSGIRVRGNNHEIKNNRIHDFNYLGCYDAPVVLRGMHNSKFINNTVFKGGRDGINYNGSNNEVAYNDVSRSNLLADDCALFYATRTNNNTEIHHNWLHDTESNGLKTKAAGIYLDVAAEGFLVHHNVIWNTEWTNIQINDGWDNTGAEIPAKNIEIYNNTLWNGEGVMGAWHFATPFENVKVWNNLGSDDKWDADADKQNNLVVTDVVFANAANGDFNLKNGSNPIDQGREIAGITDGFIGTKPDVGAYENGGDNWIAGISWDPRYGPANLGCYGLPGEDCILLPENDQDNDGVADEHDLCADTPAGATVNAVGCTVFTLAADNFSVLATGEPCESSDNGSIAITSKEISYTFTAKIEGTTIEKTFTANTLFDGLDGDDYTICITTTADADYKQCFDVTITEPEALSVLTKVDKTKSTVSLDLKGGELYRINLNGILTVTDQSQITLELSQGANSLFVTTNKDCQGQHKQDIMVFDRVSVFPTVVDHEFSIAFPDSDKQIVSYQVISSTGQVVIQKEVNRSSQRLTVNTDGLTAGLYFVNIVAPNVNSQSKIIKK